ncbi:permease [Pseudomonas syringae]|uniref:permease n=1 Tax=Pseudomonas syringae TaxID=317 RepID=UPI000D43E76F|nr:permease [Pseudomonas syringae]PPS46572.1 permease [Pseudomonas syringae]
MNPQEKVSALPQGKDVMNWKIKTLASSPREIMIIQSIFITLYLAASSLYIWGGWKPFLETPHLLVGTILALAGILAYFVGLLIRQKTIFNYTLKTDGATVEYYLHYPDFASSFFKGIAIFVMLVFGFVAILTGSLLFLVGPVAMAFIAAIKLLNWENPVHHRQTAPWQLHEFVTVDHKRLMVIIHCDDITTGFAARFPSKALMDKYLAFLREVLSANVEYIERTTNWHQG